jgi:hypothetical protein
MVLLFLIASSIIALMLAIPLFNLTTGEIVQTLSNPDAANIGVVKYFQMVQSVFLFLVPALIAAWLFNVNGRHYLKSDKKPRGITLFLVLCTLIMAIPIMNMLSLFNSEMDLPGWLDPVENKIKALEETAGRLTELFLAGGNGMDLAVNIVMIALLPALGEEFLFRGLLQGLFIEWTRNKHAGIWIAAFLFSFIHFQFYGFLPRFLLGLYFGYLLVWSSSIWVPVTGHFINNGFAVIYYHYSNRPMGETNMDKLGTGSNSHFALYLSMLLTALLVGYTYLNENRSRELLR